MVLTLTHTPQESLNMYRENSPPSLVIHSCCTFCLCACILPFSSCEPACLSVLNIQCSRWATNTSSSTRVFTVWSSKNNTLQQFQIYHYWDSLRKQSCGRGAFAAPQPLQSSDAHPEVPKIHVLQCLLHYVFSVLRAATAIKLRTCVWNFYVTITYFKMTLVVEVFF